MSFEGEHRERRGLFTYGDRIQLSDSKGKLYSFTLKEGGAWHSHKGIIEHSQCVGLPEGSFVLSTSGTPYFALRPLYEDFILAMPRGATIVYPKDSALILGYADIFPGSKILEAGAGSGALSISLLRATGESGLLHSFEERAEFADIARENVKNYFGKLPTQWRLEIGSVQNSKLEPIYDRVIFDMLAPWDCLEIAAAALKPGGLLCCYVATTTQLSRVAEGLKESGNFTEPETFESLIRPWHHEGLAVRPQHSMNAHTGFLTFARRIAPGSKPIRRRRRPAKGAYNEA